MDKNGIKLTLHELYDMLYEKEVQKYFWMVSAIENK